MARKRMFDRELINQDIFIDLPTESKALYFLLGMEADDEGFVSTKRVMRNHGIVSEDALKILIAKRFLIPFASGVVVITDWNTNNYLDKHRVAPTLYLDEKSKIIIDEQSSRYVCLTEIKPVLNEFLTSIEEKSIEEKSIEELRDQKQKQQKSIPPTLEQVNEYCNERNNGIDAERFIDYYSARGWMLGKVKMKDWKSAVHTWEKNIKPKQRKSEFLED